MLADHQLKQLYISIPDWHDGTCAMSDDTWSREQPFQEQSYNHRYTCIPYNTNNTSIDVLFKRVVRSSARRCITPRLKDARGAIAEQKIAYLTVQHQCNITITANCKPPCILYWLLLESVLVMLTDGWFIKQWVRAVELHEKTCLYPWLAPERLWLALDTAILDIVITRKPGCLRSSNLRETRLSMKARHLLDALGG